MGTKKGKNEYIFVRYAANPNWPDNIAHLDLNLSRLTRHRTKKFKLDDYEEAWTFILECKSPITKLTNILWAFPRKQALNMLKAMDALKEKEPTLVYEELRDCMSDEDIEETIEHLEDADKSFIELFKKGK